MPAKRGAQSKDQQTQQQSQQQPVLSSSVAMTGPTAATAVTSAGKVDMTQQQQQQQLVQLLQENADPVTVVMSVVDKKVRNLDKRKVKECMHNCYMCIATTITHLCSVLCCSLFIIGASLSELLINVKSMQSVGLSVSFCSYVHDTKI